jgi:hypothetical protein
MYDNNDFARDALLTEYAVESLNKQNYLRSLQASINDISLRAKLEDDPRKQQILNDELNRLNGELNAYIKEQQRQKRIYTVFMLVVGFFFIILFASLMN